MAGWRERVAACFKALATGDAIGKQTETLSRSDVHKWYPQGITGFEGRPGDVIPRYAGKRYQWRIGETTDDTEQTLAVARALSRGAHIRHEAIGRELLHCRKSAHPGVSLWSFQQVGDPARIASDGDGCGAAMRVAPVGVFYPSSRLNELIRGAHECAISTHGGQLALCAAAAVAAAVSAAVDGLSSGEVLDVALRASGGGIARSMEHIYSRLAARQHLVVDEIAREFFPSEPLTIVPLAISLALITQSARETALLAANLGGDSDSVASIGGAVAGALCPETVNEAWFHAVETINGDGILDVASALARHSRRNAE